MIVDPELSGAVCLLFLAGLGAWDGLVIHLFRERLPFRPASRLEHGIHTLRSLLFPLILATFFISRTTLALGLMLLAVDQVAEIWDMAVERRSRVHSGGLRSSEYVLHGLMIALRAAGIAFAMAAHGSRNGADAALSAERVARCLLPGAVLVAILHVVLLLLPLCRACFASGGSPRREWRVPVTFER